MKISKKLFSVLTLFLFVILLASCTPTDEPDTVRGVPTFTGVGPVSLLVGQTFSPLAGVGARDHDGVDITSSIQVTSNTVKVDEVGIYSVVYSVTDSENLTATATRAVTVNTDVNAKLFAEGNYNYRFASPELRNTFFAAAESYLVRNVAGGVPLFINSGSAIYSSRVQLPVQQFVPVMGWGSSFATLTQDDTSVTFSGGKVGEAGKKTYRSAFTLNPTTLNQWLANDSVSSDALSYMTDSLYAFLFNSSLTGYELSPSMASALPTPINPETLESGLKISDKWSVPVRSNLKWGFHPQTVTTGLETDITAQTFVDTYRFALENGWFRATAGGSHFWAASNAVVGAQAFRNYIVANPTATQQEKDAEWAKVGIKVVNNSIEFNFISQLSEWNVSYWLSSNSLSPVHLGLLQREGISNYARTPQQMAFSGAYYLDTFERDKVLEYKRNVNFHDPNRYNFDGHYVVIIERAEIIFAEFEAGNLDGAGVPLTKFEQYRSNPGLKRSPGATTFRMAINGFGTASALNEVFPDTNWVPEPILSNVKMKQALYFAIDRRTLALDILKTSDPFQFYFSDAYLVDPQTGIAFRQTPQGTALGLALSPNTYGFAPDLALSLFKEAVKESIDAGLYTAGTSANPRVINIDLTIQANSTAQSQLGEFIKNAIESLFVDPVNNVKFSVTLDPVVFPDNYYQRSLIGRYDLATGGISGSTLDASSFLEVFTSDNRGGFTLDYGFDTSIADIPVSYTTPSGVVKVNEYWSFDAITAVLNGPVTVSKGVEVLDAVAIKEVIDSITALPEVSAYDHALHSVAVNAANAAFGSLLPRAQAAVTNVSKLDALVAARTSALNDIRVSNVVALIEALSSSSLEAEVVKAVTDYRALSAVLKSRVSAELVSELADYYAVFVNQFINEIPSVITTQKVVQDSITKANNAYNFLKDLVSAEKLALLVLPARYEVITSAQSQSRVLTMIERIESILVNENKETITLQAFIDQIKLTNRFAIQDVRTAFNSGLRLTDAEKALVTNLSKLVAVEAAVKPLVDSEQAFLWTLNVDALAAAVDLNDVRVTNKVQIEILVREYNALSNEAKLLVSVAPSKVFNVPSSLAELLLYIDALEDSGVTGIVEPVLPTTQPS